MALAIATGGTSIVFTGLLNGHPLMREMSQGAAQTAKAVTSGGSTGETDDQAHWSAHWIEDKRRPDQRHDTRFVTSTAAPTPRKSAAPTKPSRPAPARRRRLLVAGSAVALAALATAGALRETDPLQRGWQTVTNGIALSDPLRDMVAATVQSVSRAVARAPDPMAQVAPGSPIAAISSVDAERIAMLEQKLAEAVSLSGHLETRMRQAEAEAEKLLAEAYNRAAVLMKDATAARQDLAVRTEQLSQALERERSRSAALDSELALARRQIEAAATQLRGATDEANRLRRAEAAKSALASEHEQQKIAALAEAAATRRELESSVSSLKQALDTERTRSATLTAERAAAAETLNARSVQLRELSDEAARAKAAGEATIAALREDLQRSKTDLAGMAEQLASARARPAQANEEPDPLVKAIQPGSVAETNRSPEISVAKPAATAVSNSAEASRLIARAGALLGQGDISSARAMLERAAETGSARASFMLAETYDPGILSAWGTYGTRGEVTRARELYARAEAGGIQEARQRVDALPR